MPSWAPPIVAAILSGLVVALTNMWTNAILHGRLLERMDQLVSRMDRHESKAEGAFAVIAKEQDRQWSEMSSLRAAIEYLRGRLGLNGAVKVKGATNA